VLAYTTTQLDLIDCDLLFCLGKALGGRSPRPQIVNTTSAFRNVAPTKIGGHVAL